MQKKQKQKAGYPAFIDSLLSYHEAVMDNDNNINVISISEISRIDKRRIYDLMNVLCACGVCTKKDTHTYQWEGLNKIQGNLLGLAKTIEFKTVGSQSISKEDIFQVPDSMPIGILTTMLLTLYLYLGTQSLNIREVSFYLGKDEQKEKQLMRRLYSVVYLLEKIKILKRGQRNGDYEMIYDIKEIAKLRLEEFVKNGSFPPDSIEYQLNRFDDMFIVQSNQMRMSEYTRYVQAKIMMNKYQDNSYFSEISIPEAVD